MKMCEIEPDMHIASAAGDQQPLESATERPQVEDLLSKLSLSQQEVIVNRFIQGKPYDEISKHLNISPTTVRKRVQRAREILRREGAVLARCATGGGR
jgi:RNA polymerase sigma factor (sigma-70 family)